MRRFGMVHVDFETQKRTPKQSFHAYREIIARNRKRTGRLSGWLGGPDGAGRAFPARVRAGEILGFLGIMTRALAASEAPIDGETLQAELVALAGKPRRSVAGSARRHLARTSSRRWPHGRAEAEKRLKADGKGSVCAAYLSALQDSIIQAVYGLATDHVYLTGTRSTAERMAVVAVGGYGRGTLAPGSDVDLLFLLPYKQTPWGESVVEFILYLLWDLGLKVGHATRSVDECIRLARSDMTIRTAVLEARYI